MKKKKILHASGCCHGVLVLHVYSITPYCRPIVLHHAVAGYTIWISGQLMLTADQQAEA